MKPFVGFIRDSSILFSAKRYALLGAVLKYFVYEVG